MGGKAKPAGKKFDFKIKIVRTDLASRDYLFGAGEAFGFDGDPAMYQNSSYISKLWFINSYSGAILAKDKIEDMPERYRRFVRFGNPSETEMIRNFQKEMVMLSNREQIGQNTFYSRLSNQPPPQNSSRTEPGETPGEPANAKYADIAGNFEGIAAFESFKELVEEVLYGEEEADFDDEEYEDDEEIRDILQLNNVYNSEIYKMSKVEYDFSAPGSITKNNDGNFDIQYDETETTGIEGSYMRILFSEKNRDIASFFTKSYFDDWFTLEKGKRVSIERVGAGFGTVTATSTKELANSITLAGGELCAVYTTEVNGVPTESVSYFIQAKPAAEQKSKPKHTKI